MIRQLDIFSMNSYHDTVPERDTVILQNYEDIAREQDEKIMKFFERHPGKYYTPYQVWEAVDSKMLVQSVRRSLTTLTKQGKLVIVEGVKVMERQGRNNNVWKLK